MRSRYTAFVRQDADYLIGTWHPGTRPTELTLDPDVRWRGLTILHSAGGAPDDRKGTVEFRAAWREGSSSGILHERSRFVKQSARWWYLDGVLDPSGSHSESGT
jgi:SEC-C motif-containing protein